MYVCEEKLYKQYIYMGQVDSRICINRVILVTRVELALLLLMGFWVRLLLLLEVVSELLI